MAKDRKQAKAAERKAKLKSKQQHQQQASRVRNRIGDLFEHDPAGSAERLAEMHRRQPDDRNIFVGLLEACTTTGDLRQIRTTCQAWLVRHPQDREVWRSYAGVCIELGYVWNGKRAAETVVARWPDWVEADACRSIINAANKFFPELVRHLGPDTRDIVLERHEAVRSALEESDFEEAVRLARLALRESPQCHPIRNNLVQSLCLLSRYSEAIHECEEQLGHDPHNVFAWVSLTRALYLLGRDTEAQAALQKLLVCQSDRDERWVKTAEALAVMGEDQQLLDWTRPVMSKNLDKESEPVARAMLRHYAACAEYRLGDEKAAKKLWQDALKFFPFSTAEENLDELEKPIDDRDSAWFFSFGELYPRRMIDDFLSSCKGLSPAEESQFARNYVQKHPEIRRLTEVLLDRGDPVGRELATRLCKVVADEQSLTQLEAFARGRRGRLELRIQMTEPLIAHGRIKPGAFTTWLSGQPTEVKALGFEICFEPMEEESNPVVMALLEKAHHAMGRGDKPVAIRLFREAAQLAPNEPSHLNNIAAIRQLEPGFDFKAAVRDIHARWPDYVFAKMALASILARDGKVKEARALVLPVVERRKLHFTEFRGLVMCQVDIELADKRIPAAKMWLDMAKGILSDEEDFIDQIETRIAMADPKLMMNRIKSMLRRIR